MLRNFTRVIILVYVFIALFFIDSWAQRPAALIKKIVDMSGIKPAEIDSVTEKVKIHRKASGEWIMGAPKKELFWKDRILVEEFTRVVLHIKRKNQRGKIFLLPDSLKTFKKRAVYEIQEDPKKLGRLQAFIEHGSLVVDWAHGKLSVIALGIQSTLSGTKVAFVIDSTRGQGFAFLQQGALVFPDYPNIKMRPMDAVLLRRGMPPVIFVPDFQAASEIRNFIHYNSKNLWSQFIPWWQKPIFYVPTAAVGAGASVYIISQIIAKKEEPDLPGPPDPPTNP